MANNNIGYIDGDFTHLNGYRVRDEVAHQFMVNRQFQDSIDQQSRMLLESKVKEVEKKMGEIESATDELIKDAISEVLDPTLSEPNRPADAYATGQAIEQAISETKYTLPNASTSSLGGVKVGAGLSIASDGTLSATGDGGVADSVEWDNVVGRPETFPSTWESVSDKPSVFPASWTEVFGKPETFPPSDHTHTAEEVGAAEAVHLHEMDEVHGLYNALSKRERVFNLLDNSNFRNPINQRGQSLYDGAGYAIDRWSIGGASSVSINSNSVTVQGGMTQYIRGLATDAELTFAYGNDNETFIGAVAYDPDLSCHSVTIPAGTWTWCALYEGKYTVETLPDYVPRGYGVELTECQRYYLKVNASLATAFVSGTGSAQFFIPLPASVLADNVGEPTLTFENELQVFVSVGAYPLTVTRTLFRNTGVNVTCTCSCTTAGSGCVPDVNCIISKEI